MFLHLEMIQKKLLVNIGTDYLAYLDLFIICNVNLKKHTLRGVRPIAKAICMNKFKGVCQL